MLKILDWLIRTTVSHSCFQVGNRCSSHRLTMQTWCCSYQTCDPIPRHTYYNYPPFCIFTLNSEMTPGELAEQNFIPRMENFNPRVGKSSLGEDLWDGKSSLGDDPWDGKRLATSFSPKTVHLFQFQRQRSHQPFSKRTLSLLTPSMACASSSPTLDCDHSRSTSAVCSLTSFSCTWRWAACS